MKWKVLVLLLFVSSWMEAQDFLADCDSKIRENGTRQHKLNDDYEFNKKEINQGLICSKCKRTKSQIREETGQQFQAHLTKVEGEAIKPTFSELQEAKKKLRNEYDNDWNRLQEERTRIIDNCDKKLQSYEKEQENIRLEKEQEDERQRLAYLAQLQTEKMAFEQDLFTQTSEVNTAIRTGVNLNVQNRIDEIDSQGDEIRGLQLGAGLNEDGPSYEFDKDKMNEMLEDISIENDEFKTEYAENLAATEESFLDQDHFDEFVEIQENYGYDNELNLEDDGYLNKKNQTDESKADDVHIGIEEEYVLKPYEPVNTESNNIYQQSVHPETFIDNSDLFQEANKNTKEPKLQTKEWSQYFGEKLDNFSSKVSKLNQNLKNSVRGGMINDNSATIAGTLTDVAMDNYHLPVGNTISTYNEYKGYKNAIDGFGGKLNNRRVRYQNNLLPTVNSSDYDYNYNIDEDFKTFWFDLVESKTGIPFNKIRPWFMDKN